MPEYKQPTEIEFSQLVNSAPDVYGKYTYDQFISAHKDSYDKQAEWSSLSEQEKNVRLKQQWFDRYKNESGEISTSGYNTITTGIDQNTGEYLTRQKTSDELLYEQNPFGQLIDIRDDPNTPKSGGYAPNHPNYKEEPKQYIDDPVQDTKTSPNNQVPERTFEENYELLKNELAQNAKAVERYDPNWLEKYNSEHKGEHLATVVGALENSQLQWLRKNYDNILGMRLNQTSTTQQQAAAPSFAAPKISVSKTVLTRKAAPVEPLVRTVNADMLDYSAYTGRSAAIAKATLSRKALETYQARIAAQTAGMPITDISRR